MNRIKDFIYDKNDLLIALLIVVAAAFVIISRVDVIMAYPTSLAAEAEAENGKIIAVSPDTSAKPPKADNSDGQGGEETPQAPDEGEEGNGEAEDPSTGDAPTVDPPAGQISIYIKSGATGSEIAQLLIDSGLIDSKQIFYDAVTAAGADTRLQAGNFKIPPGATPAEIVRIITK